MPAGNQLWNSGHQCKIFSLTGDQESAISDPVVWTSPKATVWGYQLHNLYIYFQKTEILFMLSLVHRCVKIRVRKYGCDLVLCIFLRNTIKSISGLCNYLKVSEPLSSL